MNHELIQTTIGITGVVTIILLWWQIKSQLTWNKINLSLNKIDLSVFGEKEKYLSDSGIDMEKEEMSNEDYEKIINPQNTDLLYRVCDILDMFENFSALYNMNVLNKFFAYEVYSENVLFVYSKFNKIIDFCRVINDPFYYKNLVICADKFSKIKLKEQKNKKKTKENEKLKQKIMYRLEKIQTEKERMKSIIN